MRLWFEILTPKQVNFFKPVIDELRKDNEILCTSRAFRETLGLAKLKGLELEVIGGYGSTLYDKLLISAERIQKLTKLINDYKPDHLITFSSPDACRVAFGLQIPILCFNDSPHAEAVCKLTIPLVNKLMHPWIIPSEEFIKYGIDKERISVYKALDPVVWIENLNHHNNNIILFRVEESQAAYLHGKEPKSIKILKVLSNAYNIVVLCRYDEQIKTLKEKIGNITIQEQVVDAMQLLKDCSVFIGSGGTMNCEAALLGIPNIMYNMQDIHVNRYLISNNLSYTVDDPYKMMEMINRLVNEREEFCSKSKQVLASMEDLKSRIVKEILMLKKN